MLSWIFIIVTRNKKSIEKSKSKSMIFQKGTWFQKKCHPFSYHVYQTREQTSCEMVLHQKSSIPKTVFFAAIPSPPFPPVVARPQPRCASHKQCSDEGAHMRPLLGSNNTNVRLDATRQSRGLPTMRGMTRIKIGGRYETRGQENCYSNRLYPSDGSFAFNHPAFQSVLGRSLPYRKLPQL